MNSTRVRRATITNDTSIYAAADQLGELVTLAGAFPHGSGFIHSVSVIDIDKEKKGFTVLFFNAEPTVASVDNAALDIVDAQMTAKFVGHVSFVTADYKDVSGSSFATKILAQPLPVSTINNSLYLICMADEAGTYTASGDLNLAIGLSNDV